MCRNSESGLCLENVADKVVHMRTNRLSAVVAAVDIVPDVRCSVRSQHVVVALRCGIDQCVIRAGADEEQIRLNIAEFELVIAQRNAGSRTHRTDIAEQVRACQTDVQRLSAAHRETCDCRIVSSSLYGIMLFHIWHDLFRQQ